MSQNIPDMTELSGKKILVVGAGGFLGGYLVAEGLKNSCEIWAGVRKSTKRDRFTDPRINFVEFDFTDPASLAESMQRAMGDEKWDYIIYNLGATKVKRYADFNRINYEYLRYFTGALHQAGKVPEKLLYISSLSVMGRQGEKDYSPMTEEMVPQPNTRYGASKLKAELWLATAQIPYVIFRPTGIYGPWDKDYFLMFDSIRKGFDFGVGFRKQMLTFIYAEDLAIAAYMALLKAPAGEVYNISETTAYSQKQFRKIAMKEIGKKFVMPLRFPLWIVKGVCAVSEKIGAFRGKPSTLNKDKFRILSQRNWKCTTAKAFEDFGFRAPTSLEKGVAQTVGWYASNDWKI